MSRLSDAQLSVLASYEERPVRTMLAVVTVGLLAIAAPQAVGQAAGGLAAGLAKGVTCASPDASAGLLEAVAKTTAPAADILAALGAIAGDAEACEPVRNAAKELVVSLTASVSAVSEVAAVPEVQSAATSSPVAVEVRPEAERGVASLKFDVGPPPPNLTKGRNPGL